jgi:ABC-type siderophore export system fused ATPase/permease subunit
LYAPDQGSVSINGKAVVPAQLALFQCYLEDSPLFLFDEVAADQDPAFRQLFYRELLKEMKARGKIVIAITHDDHYFDAADKIIKMDMGQIDYIDPNPQGPANRLRVGLSDDG